jgi:hypothetical protein
LCGPRAARPIWLRTIVRVTRLHQGVPINRARSLGWLQPGLLANVANLVALFTVGCGLASRRFERLLLP